MLRLALFTLLLAYSGAAVISAGRGDRPWGWWEIGSAVAVAAEAALVCYVIRMLVTGGPELIVDRETVAVGNRRRGLPELRPIGGSSSFNPPGFGSVALLPVVRGRRAGILVTSIHVKSPDAFGRWLEALRTAEAGPDVG